MQKTTFEVQPSDTGIRLDKFLAEQFDTHSREQIQKMIRDGQVLVNGELPKISYRVQGNDSIVLDLPENRQEAGIIAQEIALEVLYEDEHLLAINKHAGLVVHPGHGNEQDTLVNALFQRYPNRMAEFEDYVRAGIVHRLDKDTSGVLLIALNPTAREALAEQFKARTVEKIYWGLVDGHPPTEMGRIDAPIRRDPKRRKRMAVLADGKPAQTNFRGLEAYLNHTLLEVHIETGRTHQIRVHMAYIGCPIAGDLVYGLRKPTLWLGRFFLHARRITFQHPVSGQAMTIEAPLPPELQAVLDQLAKERDKNW